MAGIAPPPSAKADIVWFQRRIHSLWTVGADSAAKDTSSRGLDTSERATLAAPREPNAGDSAR
jgi:hypothetical protein